MLYLLWINSIVTSLESIMVDDVTFLVSPELSSRMKYTRVFVLRRVWASRLYFPCVTERPRADSDIVLGSFEIVVLIVVEVTTQTTCFAW